MTPFSGSLLTLAENPVSRHLQLSLAPYNWPSSNATPLPTIFSTFYPLSTWKSWQVANPAPSVPLGLLTRCSLCVECPSPGMAHQSLQGAFLTQPAGCHSRRVHYVFSTFQAEGSSVCTSVSRGPSKGPSPSPGPGLQASLCQPYVRHARNTSMNTAECSYL